MPLSFGVGEIQELTRAGNPEVLHNVSMRYPNKIITE